MARLPTRRVLLPHTYTQDGWFSFCNQNENADQLDSIAGLSLLIVYVGAVEYARASLSPRVLLPHTCTQDGWFLHQNPDQLRKLRGRDIVRGERDIPRPKKRVIRCSLR
jgi:hypothetical protein